MNKKLIALAIAGACVAPEVMAQTANPVTLYGRIYLTFESVEAKGGTAPVARRNRIQDQASYLGVRGSEDLGGGLKAVFQLETAFSPDEASGTFANRNSMVGLQGKMGTLFMGRWDTPMKMTQTAVDPWGDLTTGDITGAALDQGNFSRRQANSVQWWSPKFGGFDAKLLYSTNEGKTATASPEVWGASLAYSGGPIYVAYAYEKHEDQLGSTVTSGAKEEGNTLAARFTMGKLRLSGHYGEYKKTGLAKEKSYMIGADWALGKHVILGSYQNAELGSADCDMYSVGYRYDFTRRTFFIGSYTKVDNSTTMNCNFGTGSLGASGQDPQGFGLGVRHIF